MDVVCAAEIGYRMPEDKPHHTLGCDSIKEFTKIANDNDYI